MYKTNSDSYKRSVSFTDRNVVVVKVALSDQRREFIKLWLSCYKYSVDLADYWARRIQEINDSEAAIYKFEL